MIADQRNILRVLTFCAALFPIGSFAGEHILPWVPRSEPNVSLSVSSAACGPTSLEVVWLTRNDGQVGGTVEQRSFTVSSYETIIIDLLDEMGRGKDCPVLIRTDGPVTLASWVRTREGRTVILPTFDLTRLPVTVRLPDTREMAARSYDVLVNPTFSRIGLRVRDAAAPELVCAGFADRTRYLDALGVRSEESSSAKTFTAYAAVPAPQVVGLVGVRVLFDEGIVGVIPGTVGRTTTN